jgi:hypothetical protein
MSDVLAHYLNGELRLGHPEPVTLGRRGHARNP